MKSPKVSKISLFMLGSAGIAVFTSRCVVQAFASLPTALRIPSTIPTRLSSSTTETTTKPPSLTVDWSARTNCWRPTVNDVERISWGKPAQKKKTGSRGVPHRLNQDERQAFDRARTYGFLSLNGSGYRSERADAPLLNSYRSLCDARAQPCIVYHKQSNGVDTVTVDLSPLRLPQQFESIGLQLQQQLSLPAALPDASVFDSSDKEDALWNDHPVYHLPGYCIVWDSLLRPDAKQLSKQLASVFATNEGKRAPSRKPTHVKHGNNRRHGGYGIG